MRRHGKLAEIGGRHCNVEGNPVAVSDSVDESSVKVHERVYQPSRELSQWIDTIDPLRKEIRVEDKVKNGCGF